MAGDLDPSTGCCPRRIFGATSIDDDRPRIPRFQPDDPQVAVVGTNVPGDDGTATPIDAGNACVDTRR